MNNLTTSMHARYVNLAAVDAAKHEVARYNSRDAALLEGAILQKMVAGGMRVTHRKAKPKVTFQTIRDDAKKAFGCDTWFKTRDVSARIGVHRGHVSNALKRLVDKGFLEKRQFHENRGVNEYRFKECAE